MGRRARGAAQLWLRIFPDKRELIFRTDGHVRYLSVPRSWQLAAVGAVLLAVGWGAIATYGFIDAAGQTRVQAQHIASAASANRRWSTWSAGGLPSHPWQSARFWGLGHRRPARHAGGAAASEW